MLDDGLSGEEVKKALGTPNIYVVLTWIQKMLETMEPSELKTEIEQAMAANPTKEMIQYYFPWVKKCKTRRPEVNRLEISAPLREMLKTPNSVQRKTILVALEGILPWLEAQKGYKLLLGTAPPGEMERVIQKYIEESQK